MFSNLGTTEILIIAAIFIIFFGAKKIPEFARGLGKGIREFKDASSGIREEINQSMDAPKTTTTPPRENAVDKQKVQE